VTRLQTIKSRSPKAFLGLTIVLMVLCQSVRSGDLSTDPVKICRFADHLFREGDYLRAAIEYERYLYLSAEPNDTILFRIGLCHQFRERYDYAADVFQKIAGSDSSELRSTARLAVLYNLTKLQKWEAVCDFGYRNDDEFYFYYFAGVKLDTPERDQSHFNKVQDDSLRTALSRLDDKRQRLKPKSPLLSATLSTVIPGLGKAYLGRCGDAIFAGGMTGFAALLTWKAFTSKLIVTGVVTSGITLSFYLGTIYGSYIGARLYNDHIRDTWFDELETFNPVNRQPYWTAWQK